MNKKTFISNISRIALFMLIVIFIAGCGGNTSTNSDNNATGKDSSSIAKEVTKIVYPLPTPLEVTQLLNQAGANFILDITNPSKSVDKYFTEKGRAINLGIYGADLSYASTYNKTQQVTDLMSCSKKLTDELGINTPFSAQLIKRVDANIDKKDSLYKIIKDSYYDTFEFLNKNNKGAVSILILAGGWVEGLYLSCELANLTKKNDEIIKGIAKQKSVCETLDQLMSQYKENKDVNDIKADLQKFKAVYDKVDIAKNESGLNADQFKNLYKVTQDIRTKFVQLQ
jgi:hypothetical protein